MSACRFALWVSCECLLADVMCAQEGVVYAVEFSHRSGRDLINVAKRRRNIIPIVEDARHPLRYRMLIDMVCIFFFFFLIFVTVLCAHPL